MLIPGKFESGTQTKFPGTRSGLDLELLVRPYSGRVRACRPSVVRQMCVAWWNVKLYSHSLIHCVRGLEIRNVPAVVKCGF